MFTKHMILLLVSLSLAACGTMPGDRAISGAGIGAAGGAIVGAVTGLTVLEGAAIGAAAGALTGVLTDKDKVNLGKPVWKQDTASSPQTSAEPASENHTAKAADVPAKAATTTTAMTDTHVVMEIQSGLVHLGYNPGPVDGIYGQHTRNAIRAYQEDNDLLVDGQATMELAEHIHTSVNYLHESDAQNAVYQL